MNTTNRISSAARLALATCVAISTLLVTGCGSGSGAQTVTNPTTTPPPVSNYTGPAPQTADVQRFKINVWDNLVPNNRCGTCHNPSQAPRFVRNDDINLAYDEANTVVDLTDPANSRMVLKVRGGHNCWLTSNDACGDIIQSYIEAWAGGALGGGGKQIQFIAPPLQDPGSSKNFPPDAALFDQFVYQPYLSQYCVGCHKEDAAIPQSPFFASDDVNVAYAAAQSKIDLDNPANSRFVLRLGNEFHNCWSDCAQNAAAMQAGITAMSNGIAPTVVDPTLITSKALKLTDGIVASSGGRHEANVIALYEFKTGTGNQAFDTSGVEPALNLTLSGTYSWVGGWGVSFTNGKAQGSTTASAKLHDLIKSTGEYSVEAWVAPGNVTQDGPSRIISYSGGSTSSNFLLGQTLYQYDFLNRSSETDQAGEPRHSTAAADEDLQATLQHVVVTYDPTGGRRIYVNGEFTGDVDAVPGGLLTDWDNTFALALASEVDNTNRWAGVVRLLAIHNRALTPEQITQNFDVGVGEKYFLLFNVSDYVNLPDAYVVFEVSQFDSYSYLFRAPFFILLDGTAMPGSIPMAGIRIGVNGREVTVGQAYKNVNVTVDDAQYVTEGRQYLSSLGTVVALEKGPVLDEFFLTFERLGSSTNVVIEAPPAIPAPPSDTPRLPDIGIRNFAEVNATMAEVTGVPTTNAAVKQTYDAVFQALPVATGIEGFLSSQQMGITQLAISYCSALVDGMPAGVQPAGSYFPGFNVSLAVGSAFSAAGRSAIVDPLYARMVGATIGTQPDETTTKAEVNALIDRLVVCSGADCADTRGVVKAACASVLGSAAMLVQ
jgi:Concanavalin A-like lectin/glucanases superfamily